MIKSRRLRWAGYIARLEEVRRAFKMLIGKPTERESLGRLRCRWEDNIRIHVEEMGINTRNWVDSAHFTYFLIFSFSMSVFCE